jgi:hypothetical protein
MATQLLCVILQAEVDGRRTIGFDVLAVELTDRPSWRRDGWGGMSSRYGDRAAPGASLRCRHVACCDSLRGLQQLGRGHVLSTGTDANRWSQ